MADAISDTGRGTRGTRGLPRLSEQDFRRIMNDAPFGWFQCLPDRMMAASRKLADMLGWESPDEMLADGMFCADFLSSCGFDADEPAKSANDHRVEFHRKDGSSLKVKLNLQPVTAASGGVRFFQGFVEDLATADALDQELREARETAMRGQLASGIAHDFNDVLSAALVHLGLLLQDPEVSARHKESLEVMRKETERAAELTRQLLSFSQRTAAAIQEPLYFNRLIEDMLRMMRQLTRENILVVFLPAKEECRINGDARLIEMLLMQVCLLARRTLPHGGTLTLATSIRPAEQQAGPYVCLSITQSRPIADERSARKSGATAVWIGSSLAREDEQALHSMKEIVDLHHGQMEMPARFDRDAVYRVFFPVAAKVMEASPAVGDHGEIKGGNETVLVIEDDRYLRRMTALSLRKLGYAVLEAGDAEEAAKTWDKHREKIDVIFTDFLLTGSSTGLELARRLEQQKPSVKLLVCSGQGADFEESIAAAGSGVVFLPKPYTIVGLGAALRECLDKPRVAVQPA
jgi:PAS domain S-box-containing protein